jgi:hypothetical protein
VEKFVVYRSNSKLGILSISLYYEFGKIPFLFYLTRRPVVFYVKYYAVTDSAHARLTPNGGPKYRL